IVASSDNVGVTGITLTFDGQVVAIDTAGRATVLANRAGFIPGVATVVDAAGNVGKAPITVTVIDRSDTDAPIATITAPADDAVITAPVPVIGTASDTNLFDYSLELEPVAGGAAVEIAHGTSNVTNGVLGTLDPSRFSND